MTGSLAKDGYTVARAVLSPTEADSIAERLSGLPAAGAGSRNLLDARWCRDLAGRIRGHYQISPELPAASVAIQCTLFDKTAERNWLVGFHQDVSVPVHKRVEHPELATWSVKEGRHYVQAPVELLQQMVAVRLHIDDCGLDNGPLRVIAGSHNAGRVESDFGVARLRQGKAEVAHAIDRGGALLFRPLLLHASSKASVPGHRRVLHFLFGPAAPGYGLRWAQAI